MRNQSQAKNYRRCAIILVDDRTGSGELDPLLAQPSILCRLDFADFAWSGSGPEGQVSVGVERKRLLDLMNSMASGRLSGHQLIGLTEEYDWVYLLVEGIWQPDRKTGMVMRSTGKGRWQPASKGSRRFMAREIYNFINSLVVMCGVIPVMTANKYETASWLDACYGWWQKGWDKHKSHLQFTKPVTYAHLEKPNLVTRWASQLDGIGWDKARKIGQHFRSVHGLLYATPDELCEVDGIGKVLANKIIKQMGED